MNKVVPLAIAAGCVGLYLTRTAWNTGQAVQRLSYGNPRVKINRVTLTNIELLLSLDIKNPGSVDINLDYFTGDLYYEGSKLSSFTFNANGKNVALKSRQITTVPFTVIISNLGALQTITKIIKAITMGTKITTVVNVDGSIYAGGFDVPVKFSYDLKTNTVAGIGALPADLKEQLLFKTKEANKYRLERNLSKLGSKRYKAFVQLIKLADADILELKQKISNSVSGIGSVKATLEFGSNQDMEKYFTGKRIEKKMLFSKN